MYMKKKQIWHILNHVHINSINRFILLFLDDFDDHGLIEEPEPKHTSVFVDKWVSYI